MNCRTLTEEQQTWIAERTSKLVGELIRDARALGVSAGRGRRGESRIDCGVETIGSWEAGRRVVEISQGGMAKARIDTVRIEEIVLPQITVESWNPSVSAFGLQVSMPLTEVDAAIRVSGPILARFADGRLRLAREELEVVPGWGTAVVEADHLDLDAAVDALADRSRIPAERLTLIVVPTGSVAGATQIAGRINECIAFTWEESVGVSSDAMLCLLGSVPIAPAGSAVVCPDDFIHYAGRAVATVEARGLDLGGLAERLAFSSAPIYGRRFADLLEEAGGVFEAIPGLVDLNKVAQVTLIDACGGRTFAAGVRDEARLAGWLRGAPLQGRETK